MPDNNTPNKPKDIKSLIKEVGDTVVKNKSNPNSSLTPSTNKLSDDEILSLFKKNEPQKKSPDESGKTGTEDSSIPAKQQEKPLSSPGISEEDKAFVNKPLPDLGKGIFASEGTATDPNKKPENFNQQEHLNVEKEEKIKEEEKKKLDNGINRVNSALGTFDQKVYGLPSDMLEAYAIVSHKFGQGMSKLGVDMEVPVEQQETYKWAQQYRTWLKEIMPDNPAYQDEIQTQVSSALGDLVTLVGSSGAKAATKIPILTREIQAFNKSANLFSTAMSEGRKLVSTPPSILGAIKTGTSEWEQAKAAGASDDEAFGAFLKNAAAGSVLEAVPISHFFKRLDETTGGGVKNAIKNGVTQGVEEMTTEVAQQVFANVDAANTYDTTRKWYEGMTESGGIGFGLGFVLGAMGTSLRQKKEQAKTPEEKAEIQKAIDFTEQKSKELADSQTKLNEAKKEAEKNSEPSPNEPQIKAQKDNLGNWQAGQPEANITQEVVPEKKQGLSSETLDAIDNEINFLEPKPEDFIGKDINDPEKLTNTEPLNQNQDATTTGEIQQNNIEQRQGDNGLIQGEGNNRDITSEKQTEGDQTSSSDSVQRGQEISNHPEISDPAEVTEPEKKERKFPKQILSDPDISEEIKKGLSEDAKTYIPKSNDLTVKEANAIVESKGIDNAIKDLVNTSNDMKPRVRVALAESVIKQSNKAAKEATTEQEKNLHLDKAIEAADFISKHLTELGQGVQAAAIYNKLSPEGMYRSFKKRIDKISDSKLEPHSEQIKKVHKILNQLNEESINKVLEHPEIKKRLEGAVKVKPLGTKEAAVRKAIDKLEKFKIDTKGKAFDVTYKLTAEVYNGAISVIQTGLKAGLTISKAIQKGVDYIRKNHSGEWDEKGFRNQFDEHLKEHEAHLDPTMAIQRALKERGTTIQELVRKHYTTQGKTKNEIVDKLVSEAGLSEKDAKELSDNIHRKFEKVATKAKEAALKKESSILEKVVRQKKTTDQKLIELSNLGALNEESVRKIFSDKLGIKTLSEQDGKRIFELSDKIQEADNFGEETEKNFTQENVKKYLELKNEQKKAINELSDLLNEYKPKNVWDTLGTILQGNLLSPISIVTNVYSNSLLQPLRFVSRGIANVLDMGISKAFNRPRKIDIAAANKGYWNGTKEGLAEGFRQLKSGNDVEEMQNLEISRGFKPLRSLVKGLDPKESQAVSERVNNLIEGTFGMPAEGVFRLLNLGDKPFLRAAELAKAYELAELKGLKGDELNKFLLFPDKESAQLIKEAGEEATFKSSDGAGQLASNMVTSINNYLWKIPVVGGPLKLFLRTQIPFVKTPINIISETFDYALPALSMTKSLYYGGKVKDREKALTYLGKATVGLILQATIDKLLEDGIISGEPEKDKSERGLQYEAFPPYGINVSALYRSMNGGDPKMQKGDKWMAYNKTGVFYTIAAMRANMSKQEKEDEKEFSGKLINVLKENASALPEAGNAALESSFLQGANTLLNAIKGDEYEQNKWAANTFRAITSIPIPNTINSISRAERQNLLELNDPNLMTTFGNVLKDKLFMADDIPSKIDFWGDPIKQTPGGSANKYIYHFFDVTKTRDISADPLSYEIFKLWKKTENKDVIPSIPGKTINVDDVKIKLNPKQYEELQKQIGKARKELTTAYINSPAYQTDSDEEKIGNLKDAYDEGYEEGKDFFVNQVLNVNQ
jgi:hypothetical protein